MINRTCYPSARAALVACTILAGVGASPAASQGAPALPRYEVDLTVRPSRGEIEVAVEVRFPMTPAGTEHQLLLGPTYLISTMRAEGATVDTAIADTPIPGLRRITLRTNGTAPAVLTLRYAGPLFDLQTPSINVVNDSLVELSVDSFWLPFQAALGSPFVISARVRGLPRPTTAVSNVSARVEGGVLRLESGSEGAIDLAFLSGTDLTPRDAGRFRMLAVDHESPLAAYYRAHGAIGVAYLERLLGAMPGTTATISLVRRASGRGYARPGYVVVTETPGAQPGPGQAKFVVHEFAHLWFSRASLSGEDYWLVESTSEYLGLRYVRDSLGADALESLMVSKRRVAASAPPILGRGRATDGALYSKGPILLFELEERIGRARFDDLLARLAREPRHTTAIFLELLRAISGEAVATEFGEQLKR